MFTPVISGMLQSAGSQMTYTRPLVLCRYALNKEEHISNQGIYLGEAQNLAAERAGCSDTADLCVQC